MNNFIVVKVFVVEQRCKPITETLRILLKSQVNFYSFKKDFIYLFLERGEEREREGEKHQCVVASHTPPTGDQTYNPGTCPDWELNQQLFGSHTSTRSTEPHQPGQATFNVQFKSHFLQEIY